MYIAELANKLELSQDCVLNHLRALQFPVQKHGKWLSVTVPDVHTLNSKLTEFGVDVDLLEALRHASMAISTLSSQSMVSVNAKTADFASMLIGVATPRLCAATISTQAREHTLQPFHHRQLHRTRDPAIQHEEHRLSALESTTLGNFACVHPDLAITVSQKQARDLNLQPAQPSTPQPSSTRSQRKRERGPVDSASLDTTDWL